jgi:hypothetical protein
LDSVSAWMFLQRFPTPQTLAQAGKRKWQNFLHSRRLWGSEQGPRRMEIFARATEFAGTAPCPAPEPRSRRAYWPKWAMTGSDSTVMLKLCNALAAQPQ